MKPSLIATLGGTLLITACASPLKVVNVNAPAINCVFNPTCKVTVTDTTAPIPLPTGGTNFLQSRTFTGSPGAPANGLTAYEYRVDLRNAMGITHIPCVSSLAVDFGPAVANLDYNGDGATGDQVYVVTGGGLGTVGLASASQLGRVVTFNFSEPVCAGGHPGAGQSSFFFGLVSAQPPRPVTAKVQETGGPLHDVPARAPSVAP